jgi:hypothetical protein
VLGQQCRVAGGRAHPACGELKHESNKEGGQGARERRQGGGAVCAGFRLALVC